MNILGWSMTPVVMVIRIFFFLAFNNYENRQDYDIVDIVDQSNLDTALYCSQSLDIYNSHRLAHKYDQKFHISMRLADVL